MPRPAKEQPLGAHLATLTRVLRQVEAGTQLSPASTKKVKQGLGMALSELQKEIVDGSEEKSSKPRKAKAKAR